MSWVLVVLAIWTQLCRGSWDHAARGGVQPEEPYRKYSSTIDPSLSIRFRSAQVCDGQAPTYNGRIDIGHKHLFFSYQSLVPDSLASAPVILWTSGCPCQSSLLGAMLETGSCLASNDGQSATMNPFTWAQAAHMIYLDESVDVGFSYADDGYDPGNPTDDLGGTAQDIISALQLLYLAFPHILGRKLHLAGQSFAGRSLPTVAKRIIEHNTRANAAALIPLESIIIENGVIHSPSQLPAIRDTVCAAFDGLPALFNRTDCDSRLASLSSDCAASQQACLDGRDPEGPMCSTAALVCENGILSAALYGRHDSTSRSPRCFQDNEYTRADDCGTNRVLALHSFISAYGGDELLIGRTAARQHVYKGLVTPPSAPLLRETGSGVEDMQQLLHQNVSTLLYYGAYDILAAPAFAERALDAALDGHVGEEWRESTPRDTVELGLGFKGSVRSASSSSSRGIIWFVQVDDVGRLVPSQSPDGALRLAQTWLHQFGPALESKSNMIIENEL